MKITVTKYGTEPQELDVDRIEIGQYGDASLYTISDCIDQVGISIKTDYRMEIHPLTENIIIIEAL